MAATMNGTDVRRRELAAFVRSRRERIGPEQVGLPPSRRRRTPGLRREEVAQLAGVGVTWYTWLEQGRDIHPSAQVLDAVARTLRLDAHERAHLFTLAGLPDAPIVSECEALCPTAPLLLEQLEPYPAAVINARFDLLAYNRAYASIFQGLDEISVEDRNCLWLAFTDPGWRRAIVDWEEGVARMVAEYRAAMAEYIDDPAWGALVARLHRVSSEFAAVWDRRDVQGAGGPPKRLLHPDLGLLVLDYTTLWLDQRLGARIVACTPADEATQEKLDRLSELLPADRALAAV